MSARIAVHVWDGTGAVRAWHRSLDIDSNATALGFLAQHFYWSREPDSAAMWAERAIRRDPTFRLGRVQGGHSAFARRRYDDAEVQFNAALRLGGGRDRVVPLGGSRGSPSRAVTPRSPNSIFARCLPSLIVARAAATRP